MGEDRGQFPEARRDSEGELFEQGPELTEEEIAEFEERADEIAAEVADAGAEVEDEVQQAGFAAMEADGVEAQALYRVIDLRGRFCPADGSWGTRSKGRGVVQHYNGGPAPARAWSDPVAWIKFITELHSQRGRFAAGWTFRGCAYHEFCYGTTVYRVMNWRADTPHCGNLQWNKNALAQHIAIGGNQLPRQVARGTMLTAMRRADDHLRAMGKGRQSFVGHREVGSSACPGEPIMEQIQRYRQGMDIGRPKEPKKPPAKPAPPSDTVYRVIAGSFSERAGANARARQIQNAGFPEPWIYQHGGRYYRVQVASYSDEGNADEMVQRLKAKGFESYSLAEKV